jgi:predicted DNA binding CopG/RHH family protein
MSIEDEISGWKRNHPVEFEILRNALSEEWIRKAIGECEGATVMTKYHPLGWKFFQASEANLAEVLWLSKFFSLFGSDKKIGVLIDQLKNKDEYDSALTHLITAYQFHRAGWKVQLEYDNRPKCVDLLVTKNGELAYVEHSQKMLPLAPPFDHRVMMGVMNRLLPPYHKIRAKLIFTGDGTEEEVVALIKKNADALTGDQENITMQSENFRIEMQKKKVEKLENTESFVTTHDERPAKSVAERLLKKIREEHEQTKSRIALRVVVLQILGPPSAQVWLDAIKKVHRRLNGLPSKPDVVLMFMKRWNSNDELFWDAVGFMTTTQRGKDAFDETVDFMLKHEKLE